MPAGLGCIAAHVLGNQAQPGRSACLGSQLQASPGGQAKRLTEFDDHQWHAAIAQRLFGSGERIGLILGLRHKQPVGIKESAKPDRAGRFVVPVFANPQQGSRRACAGHGDKASGTGAADLVNAGFAQRETGVKGNRHVTKIDRNSDDRNHR